MLCGADQISIAIRTDSSDEIGTGHFMRCLTLADRLQLRGARVRFISHKLSKHSCSMLRMKDIEFVLTASDTNPSPNDDLAHSHWLRTSQEQDAQATIQALSDQTWDWLVVDHYGLDARWENLLRRSAKQIMVIDDLADRQHNCDLLLDQNYYADMSSRYLGKVPGECRLMVGPQYTLLREEFRQQFKIAKPRTGPVNRIFVNFGGVDADNNTGRALKSLSMIDTSTIHIDIVVGDQHSHRDEIRKTCASLGYFYHEQTVNIAQLMVMADMAVGAGGVTSLERCCMGLPSIVLMVAENQRQAIVDMDEAGMVLHIDVKGESIIHDLTKKIRELIIDENKRSALSKASLRLWSKSINIDISTQLVP
jgi:UDP-2,4-diacetamido-2,4,6-trideoxy-beta-L-altropyranose hydrolase